MSAIELRSSINRILDDTPDEEILEAYYQILLNLLRVQKHVIVAYDADKKALTLEELRAHAAAASQRVASGQSISHEEAKKQAENW